MAVDGNVESALVRISRGYCICCVSMAASVQEKSCQSKGTIPFLFFYRLSMGTICSKLLILIYCKACRASNFVFAPKPVFNLQRALERYGVLFPRALIRTQLNGIDKCKNTWLI